MGMGMGKKGMSAVALALAAAVLAAGLAMAEAKSSKPKLKVCDKGWECKNSIYCCNETITDFFQVYQFENLFSKRNSPVAHAVGFWDYHSFITAAALYEPLGFGTTGGKQMQMKEVAAFLGHVGSKTSCKQHTHPHFSYLSPTNFLVCLRADTYSPEPPTPATPAIPAVGRADSTPHFSTSSRFQAHNASSLLKDSFTGSGGSNSKVTRVLACKA